MDPTLVISAFVLGACVVAMIGLLVSGRASRLQERMASLSSPGVSTSQSSGVIDQFATRVMPRLAVPLLPKDEKEQGQLKVQLVQAGFYGENAANIYLGIKMLLTVSPLVLAVLAGSAGLIPSRGSLLWGAVFGVIGLIGSRIFLRVRKRQRQSAIRRALPDALDLIVVCVDGGMSLPAALVRVGKEIRLAHPMLAKELKIVTRATEMGQSLTDSLSQFAARFDLEDLRFLSTIVAESTRYGTSVGKSLRVHAETLRTQRQQRAEEAARKATVKMLFPTLLFIFPVIFLVVLLPSLLRVAKVLRDITGR